MLLVLILLLVNSAFYPHLRNPLLESAFYPHLRNPLPESASAFRFRVLSQPNKTSGVYVKGCG
jgi:hypothetical protein